MSDTTRIYAVRRELLALSLCEKHQTRPQTPIPQILPARNRRQVWAQLESRLEISLPPLQRHKFWLFPSGVPGFFTLFFPPLLTSNGEWDVAISLFTGGALFFGPGWILTRPLAIHPASDLRNVAQLSRRFAGMTPIQSERDLWPRLRELIVDELDVPLEKVRRGADFYRDLAAGYFA